MKKWIIRAGVAIVVLAIAAVAVVYFALNSLVKKGVETVGPELTKVDVRLGSVSMSPFSGAAMLNKLFVGNPEGYKTQSAIEVEATKMVVAIGSVTSDTVEVEAISIKDPQLTLESTLSAKSNLGKILDNLNAASGGDKKEKNAAAPGAKSGKKFVVKNLFISGAKVKLAVTGLGELPSIDLPRIHLMNIGKEGGGVTAAELLQQVMKPLLQSAIDAGANAVTSSSTKVRELGKGGVNQLTNVTKGLSNLLNSK